MTRRRCSYTLVNLANAFLAGPWTLRGLTRRGKQACPQNESTVRRLAQRLVKTFAINPPSHDDVLALLISDSELSINSLLIGKCFWLPAAMAPRCQAAQRWNVSSLTTVGAVADWLHLSVQELDWFADTRGLTIKQSRPKLRHYVYMWQSRRKGRFRLIESPKSRLKVIQRRIAREILDQIPPHPSVHGFRRGRSILSYAAPHVGQRIVLRFDLRDFFSSIRSARVHALFHTVGYPGEVARMLTGLCTSRIPREVWETRPDPRASDQRLGERLLAAHLPQGAPTSPALANLCAYRLDLRLQGLAQAAGATYTRYADDLAFSGGDDLARSARRFQVTVAAIAEEEGFALHFQKSRFMRQSLRQQLAGIVVNERPNICRSTYDELKAILTNCVRHGPGCQNRVNHSDFRQHLLGRIAHVQIIHAERGRKLRALFEQIAW